MSADIIFRPPPYREEPSIRMLAGEVIDWGVDAFGLPALWEQCAWGEGVTVGVSDTGVDASHPDLADAILGGRDFTGSPSGVADRQSHGSHVAGIVGGRLNNVGMAGVAPRCRIVNLKVLDDGGNGSSVSCAAGIRGAIAARVDVLNMSWGSSRSSPDVAAAIREADAAGILLVGAAGNEGPAENTMIYPAQYPEVIAVAAVNRTKQVSTFSSRGQDVEIAAPGESIYSSVPGGRWATYSGTCLTAGTHVYTPDGPKPIESVAVGDTVYAHHGGQLCQRVVMGNWHRGRNTVHRLIAGGRDVLATETHQFLAVNTRRLEVEWVRLCELTEDHRLLLPRRFDCDINPHLDATLTEEFCWVLGFFLGDGWISETSRSERVCFAVKEQDWKNDKIQAYWQSITGKPLHVSKSRWYYDDNTRLAMVIRSLGLDHPSTEKTIPPWVWAVSDKKRQAFYDGYLAADGHAYKDNPLRRVAPHGFECGSEDLIRKLACLADYQGWQHGAVSSRTRVLAPPSGAPPRDFTSHGLRVSRVAKFGGWAELSHRRSFNGKKCHTREDLARAMGIDTDKFCCSSWRIEYEQGKTDVYDLTVPDADCFVAQGFVAHNSMAAPFVAGVLALAIACKRRTDPSYRMTRAEAMRLLDSTATDIGPPGRDTASGYGLINPAGILAALTPPAPLPPAPPSPVPPPAYRDYVLRVYADLRPPEIKPPT